MGMRRRRFFGNLMRVSLGIAAPLLWLGQKASPRRFVRALRPNRYPGPLKSLEESKIERPARWIG
jgi:hypothetical protein